MVVLVNWGSGKHKLCRFVIKTTVVTRWTSTHAKIDIYWTPVGERTALPDLIAGGEWLAA